MRKTRISLFLLLALVVAALATEYPNKIYKKKSSTLSSADLNAFQDELRVVEENLTLMHAARGFANMLSNGSFEVWSNGPAADPDGWSVPQFGTPQRVDGGRDGKYAAQVTAGASPSTMLQVAVPVISTTINSRLRGVEVSFAAWVKTSTRSTCRLEISDGINTGNSAYHSGSGNWEGLAARIIVDPNATSLSVIMLNASTNGRSTCRIDDAMLTEGYQTGTAWLPRLAVEPIPPADMGTLAGSKITGQLPKNQQIEFGDSNVNGSIFGLSSVATGNVCTAANTTNLTAFTYTIPANALSNPGKAVRIRSWATTAANTRSKTLHVKFGATDIPFTTATSGNTIVAVAYITRQQSNVHDMVAWGAGSDMTGASIATYFNSATVDPTATIDVVSSVQNGTANAADICGRGLAVEFLN